MSNRNTLQRRDWLKLLGVGAAGAFAGGLPAIARGQAISPTGGGRALRIAHLTDPHVQPERDADKGLIQCLHHVQSQADKPDLIVVTGDCVFDSFAQTRARTKQLWDLWSGIWKNECSIPMLPLLGNHDIWGWNKARSQTTGDEPEYGKRWACDVLGLDQPYYSVDRGGWHVVMLDSIQPFAERNYTARLDEEQFAWLEADLAANADKPTMVCSHVPIFSITPIMNQKPETGLGKNGEPNTILGHAVMHSDWRAFRSLFKKQRQVKLALSGHIHLIDEVGYDGVTYFCNGAVSGGWWKEAHLGEADAGYALIDLNTDGTFRREYVTYGWKYREAPTTQPATVG